MHQLVQIVGALLILSGFVASQLRILDPQSQSYLLVNLVGSAVLTADAWREEQWGFFLLELAWALVSAWGIFRNARATRWAGPLRRGYAIESSSSRLTENGRRQSSSTSPSIVSRHS